MTYANTDFFVALMKKTDWLHDNARVLLKRHRGTIWTSSVTLIELMLVAHEFNLDPERLLIDVLEIAEIRGFDQERVRQKNPTHPGTDRSRRLCRPGGPGRRQSRVQEPTAVPRPSTLS